MSPIKGMQMFLILVIVMSLCGIGYIITRTKNITAPPVYAKFNSDLNHPDTAYCYWNRGVLYIMFKNNPIVDTSNESQ